MIVFKREQSKILMGRHKIERSAFDGYLDFHLVYQPDEKSGYVGKFVRVITFENKYEFVVLRDIATNNFEDEFQNIMYFENGGYSFDKSKF